MSSLPDQVFMDHARALESAYVETDDPIEQSGFSGGRERWVVERSPLVDAIDNDGSFLDVGCANGLLAEDVVAWARLRGFSIEPFGVDLGRGLIELARQRHETHQDNFYLADAWQWGPDRTWTFVYSLLDLSPTDLHCVWLSRLTRWVEPGGRLIVGSYGSRSRNISPEPVADIMARCGLALDGRSSARESELTRFAWSTVGF